MIDPSLEPHQYLFAGTWKRTTCLPKGQQVSHQRWNCKTYTSTTRKWGWRPWLWNPEETIEFFHNSRLIRWIQLKKKFQNFSDLTRNWTQIACLTVRHLNHYTKLISVLVWGSYLILFMLGWVCPIRLIHWIQRKYLHFEKTRSPENPKRGASVAPTKNNLCSPNLFSKISAVLITVVPDNLHVCYGQMSLQEINISKQIQSATAGKQNRLLPELKLNREALPLTQLRNSTSKLHRKLYL